MNDYTKYTNLVFILMICLWGIYEGNDWFLLLALVISKIDLEIFKAYQRKINQT